MARSTFFEHQRRLNEPDKYAHLKKLITKIFNNSNATYGYRRVWRALRNENEIVNKKLVRKLMRQLGLVSKIRRKKYTSYRGTTSHIADNVLDRNFEQRHRIKRGLATSPSSESQAPRSTCHRLWICLTEPSWLIPCLHHRVPSSHQDRYPMPLPCLVQVKDSLCTLTKASSISTPVGVT